MFVSIPPVSAAHWCVRSVLFLTGVLSCIPMTHSTAVLDHPNMATLMRRDSLTISNASSIPTVIDTSTNTFIPQGSASDGGGNGYDPPAIVWIIFSFVIGVPMLLAGVWGLRNANLGCAVTVRLRLTTGVAVGLAGSMAAWLAFSNSMSASPISDLALTVIVLVFFLFFFAFGCSCFGRLTGVVCLGICGGLAFGMRIVILRPGLLINGGAYAVNIVLVSLSGVAGGVILMWGKTQKWGLLFACSSIGSFLTCLGVDLIIHKQDGMSRGLRYLLDRNASHYLSLTGTGYIPPVLMDIFVAVSLVVIPVFMFIQNYFFETTFSDTISYDSEDSGSEFGLDSEKQDTPKIPRIKLTFSDHGSPMHFNGTVFDDSNRSGPPQAGVAVGSVFRISKVYPTTPQAIIPRRF